MKVFVTGTDTDAGKTVVSAWLCLHAGADYWKPIQSGHPPDRDADVVARLSGAHIHPERHMLRAPLSGFDAARLEGKRIDLDDFRLPETARPLVIEGAGGVLVPINEHATTLDLIERLGAPVIVAARSGLGTINHTCLTLMALRARHIPIVGVALSGPLNPGNRAGIEQFGNVKVLAEIPPLEPLSRETLDRVAPQPGALDWIRWKA
ncbi:MAG: dethiobiotin synthase [Desulfovibrionaceae bacterium CG1_02_65_16]|nr:MAG: dethiobiotin synthase [Desulfovibrionaceae bacterium CG1_02_65_16]